MPIEALEGITDEQLFNEANSDEAPVEAVVEAPEAPAEQPEQPRDEAGRFAEKSQIDQLTEISAEIKAKSAEAATEAPAKVDDNAAQVPSWRVREINEEKRQLADRLTALETERNQWLADRQRLQSLEKPVAQEKPIKPDPLLDPDGYEAYLEAKWEERQIYNSRNLDLRLTRQSNTELFDQAYVESQRLKQAQDPAFLELSQKMNSTDAPGKVLLDWFQNRKVQAEVGNDPNAYFNKRFDDYLSDPANQAKVLERIRGGAQPQPGAPRQAAPVNLPPSLTRTAAAADISADDNDISNDALWRHANG